MAQKQVVNDVLCDPFDNEPTMTRKDTRRPFSDTNMTECTIALALRDLCVELWRMEDFRGSFSDSQSARRIMKAAAKAGKHLDLDEADWEWAKTKIESHGPRLFGANAPSVREALDHTAPVALPKKAAS